MQTDSKPLPVFLITGFGPFKHHQINPSNIAVTYLMDNYASNRMYTLEYMPKLDVAYNYVRKHITSRFIKYVPPSLVLHIGVGKPGAFAFEHVATNLAYYKEDVKGEFVNELVASLTNRPTCRSDPLSTPDLEHLACAVPNASDQYETQLCDLTALASHLHTLNPDWKINQSTDAGQYLCDFIYTTSMHLSTVVCNSNGARRVLFLHVPPANKPYSQEQINLFVKHVVDYLITNC